MVQNNNEYFIERFLYPCDSSKEITLEVDGLLRINEENRQNAKLVTFDEFVKLPGAILLAEGGMGKSRVMQQLENIFPGKSFLLEMDRFIKDPQGLRGAIDAFLSLPFGPEDINRAILIDGLNETPDLVGPLLHKISNIPPAITIWIASRDFDGMRKIQKGYPQLQSFALAPLREPDIVEYANQAGVDGFRFIKAVHQQGIAPICAKPIGLKMVLSVFKENDTLEGLGQVKLWHKGIQHLCDQTPSATGISGTYMRDDIVACAAWMAVCLTLSDKQVIWTGIESNCPEKQCVSISAMVTEGCLPEKIQETLTRGVFSPLSDGRVRFTHALYQDYLAAYGFKQFIPQIHWPSLLMNHDRSGTLPQRNGIAVWLAGFDKNFCDALFDIQPEILLASVDAIQTIGPQTVCTALFDRAISMSYHQRHRKAFEHNLFRLACAETSSALHERLRKRDASESEIELAIEIAEACHCRELSDALADRVLDQSLPLMQRVDAAYAIDRWDNETAKGRLKALLPINPATDSYDQLRGILLQCCWPEHLTAEELLHQLIQPQRSSFTGSYEMFLTRGLPHTFEATINASNALVFLEWSLLHITENDPYDSLGVLARRIYSHCWQWTSNPDIRALLARGYLKASKEYRAPFFAERYRGELELEKVLSRENIFQDRTGRLLVLEEIIRMDANAQGIVHISGNDYPLCGLGDENVIFEKILGNPTSSLASSWVAYLKVILRNDEIDKFAEQVSLLHNLRPDLMDSIDTLKTMALEAVAQRQEWERQWKVDGEARELKEQAKQVAIDSEIKSKLQQTDLAANHFGRLARLLCFENGQLLLHTLDLTQSPGWSKLQPDVQNSLVTLAEHYLKEAVETSSGPEKLLFSYAQALTLLHIKKPGTYEALSGNVWNKSGVEVLKLAGLSDLSPSECLVTLLNTFSNKFPDIAENALIQTVRQQLQNGYISILDYWGERLSDKQAQAILNIVGDPVIGTIKSGHILDALVQNGKETLVREYLKTLLVEVWSPHPHNNLNHHVHLALVLNPNHYSSRFLTALQTDRAWGRQWFESIGLDREGHLIDALGSCSPDVIAEVYIWLHTEYPANTEPDHEGGFMGPLDYIHLFKPRLINLLVTGGEEGSAAALEKIQAQFPDNGWLRDWCIDARNNELAAKLPVLSFEIIKVLREEKSSARRLVNSISDLKEIIIEKLDGYQSYLQKDIVPAVRDLWNTKKDGSSCWPKKEEDLSDHLCRYLNLTLRSGVVINREVQISRKLFEDGAQGSKTDLWVQAFPPEGKPVTLCIEVKCNWNPSAETALEKQLIDKYMPGNRAEAGILLLGWFECSSWDKNDNRQANSIRIWKNSILAKEDLDSQCEQKRAAGHLVYSRIIDCSLT